MTKDTHVCQVHLCVCVCESIAASAHVAHRALKPRGGHERGGGGGVSLRAFLLHPNSAISIHDVVWNQPVQQLGQQSRFCSTLIHPEINCAWIPIIGPDSSYYVVLV